MTKIGNNQSLFDIALQEFGSIEAIFNIIQDNQNLFNGITDNVNIGDEINIRAISDKENKTVKNYYKINKLKPATKDELMINEGIGYWVIEQNNIIS